jgi:peptide/nickel transport system permease protein
MGVFLFRRALSGLMLVALLTFMTFFVFNVIPTNPACLVVPCGPHTTTNDAQILEADHRLGIDRSVFAQYGSFAWRLVRHGDLGTAWSSGVNVRTAIGAALPATASIVAGGMLLMILLALPLGVIAAVRPRSPVDRGALGLSLVGLAIHPFVLGLVLQRFFAQYAGVRDSGYCPLSGGGPALMGCRGLQDWAAHLAVPWLVFALFFLPLYMRMLRVRLIDALHEPWISTARAKGASERRIVVRHALRNAVGPLLPMIAIDAGTAITAAIYIESVFQINGIGSLAVHAFSGQAGGYDLPLTAGIVTVIGGFVVVLNLVADGTSALIDPRMRGLVTGGLIPLPYALSSRPRVRQALGPALLFILIGAVAFAATHKHARHVSRINLGSPVHTFQINWNDRNRVQMQSGGHGFLKTTVTRLQVGPRGWSVRASITNATPLPVPVKPFPDSGLPGGGTYPNQGMSILARVSNGYGGMKFETLSASVFEPRLPAVLQPNASWRGVFSGSGPTPRRASLYVGFGQFLWYSHPISFSTYQTVVSP